LFDLLKQEIFLVDLDDDGGASLIATREPEFAEGIFDRLGYVYGM
jgi:hypothetical protein